MLDVELARRRLLHDGSSLVIARSRQVVFATGKSGISGFLEAIEEVGRDVLAGSSVADRVVGRAAALLCVFCRVRSVFAVVLSEGGKEVLDVHGVAVEFGKLVPRILNRRQTDMCPFEKLVAGVSDANEAFEKLNSCRSVAQSEK